MVRFAASVVAVSFLSAFAWSRDDDPTQIKVSKARKTYESKTKKIAAEVEKRLKTREDRAQRKGDKKLMDQVVAEKKAHAESGTWPTMAETKDLRKQSEAARREFTTVLKAAVAESTKQGRQDQAAAFQKELNALLDPAVAPGEDPRETAGTGVVWRIVNRNSGKVLDVAEGANKVGARVVQHAVGDRPSQLWEVLPAGNPKGSVVIRNQASGHHLHVPYGSRNSGTGTILYTSENRKGPGECWSLKSTGDWYMLAVTVSGMHLEISGSSKDDGGEAIQWPSTSQESQQWKFVRVETGKRRP